MPRPYKKTGFFSDFLPTAFSLTPPTDTPTHSGPAQFRLRDRRRYKRS